MDNQIETILKESLEREGKTITIGNKSYKVLFRRNEKDAYTTLYTLCGDYISEGAEFTINNDTYLVMNQKTTENTTYKKYQSIKTNGQFKIIYGDNEICDYKCYMYDLQDAIHYSKYGTTTDSKAEFIVSLSDASKRIQIDERFFCGSYSLAWKITDINYLNGICFIYAKRDAIGVNDDIENGIADRWTYEHKPDTYEVEITEPNISIEKGKTQQLNASVYKNSSIVTPTPTIKYTISDNSICSIDSSNIVSGISVGSTTISGSYQSLDNDKAISDSVKVVVTEPPVVVGDVTVNPIYNNGNDYSLKSGSKQTFTCNISGITSPQWNITLNANGNTSNQYKSTISGNTFTVECLKSSNNSLIYTITETTTKKVATYEIALSGLF